MELKVRLSARGHPVQSTEATPGTLAPAHSLLEDQDLPDFVEWHWPDVLECGHFGIRISRLYSFTHLRH